MKVTEVLARLERIVGITPDDGGTCESGYYMNDLRDGIPVRMVKASAPDAVTTGELMIQARRDACRNFLTDFMSEFSTEYESMHPSHSGYLGKQERSLGVNTSKPLAAWEIRSQGYPATITINGFSYFSQVTGTIEVGLYSSYDLDTPLETFTIDTQAGKWKVTDLETPYSFSLDTKQRESDGEVVYYLAWELPDGEIPRLNGLGCSSGCGGTRLWRNFIVVDSYLADDLQAVYDNEGEAKGNTGLGLTVNMSVSCSLGYYFDRLDYQQFNSDGWQWALAKVLQHGNTMSLAHTFIQSQNINAYTTLSREVVYGIRAHAEKEYRNGLKWLVKNMPQEGMECFKCRNQRHSVGEILV